jgi:hypothetical protein
LSASLGHCLEIGKVVKSNEYIHQQMQGMNNTKKGKKYIYEKVII